jgi:aldose 1-epimerase
VPAPRVSRRSWGAAHGQDVSLFTLSSGRGLDVRISNYGGVIQSISVPGRDGRRENVALGFATLEEYLAHGETTYFGAAVGRYANRIGGHSFTLGGRRYELPANEGSNCLHGGPGAWSSAVWGVGEVWRDDGGVGLTLRHVDPDGHNGFPGEVAAIVTYTVRAEGALEVEWEATTTKPTVINLTQHTYFNLAGEASGQVDRQLLRIPAARFIAIDSDQIPTGEFVDVAGTPFDFRRLRPIAPRRGAARRPWGEQLAVARGYDHCWVVNGPSGEPKLAAVAVDPVSGRRLTVSTTEPGVQLYTANTLAGDLVGSGGSLYRQGAGFALETQHYPDSPNHVGETGWPSVLLEPGQVFRSRTVYEFSLVLES